MRATERGADVAISATRNEATARGSAAVHRGRCAAAAALRPAVERTGDRESQRGAVAGRTAPAARRPRCAAVGGVCGAGSEGTQLRNVGAQVHAHQQSGESPPAKRLVHARAGRQSARTPPARVLRTLAGPRKKEKSSADGRGTQAVACHLRNVPLRTALQRYPRLPTPGTCATLTDFFPEKKNCLNWKRESTGKTREHRLVSGFFGGGCGFAFEGRADC